MKKSELLIPVGNYDCLLAAIHNGADAVYLGGKKFGARAYSNNFTDDEMISAIKLCHLYGVKIYVTINTIIFNEEIEAVTSYLNFLNSNHIDAVIMQDIGLINLTRKLFPDLDIHVSTQAHNHNIPGISYYHEIGCTRVVFDRESSLEEINNIQVPLEKEVFIYGALCICYSGNCLFSALNGYRSANRGMCVGSCRLPYQLEINNKIKNKGYLLSTKDLNTTSVIEKILASNIDSLKVEGRMKGPEYVACVTKTYRRLIDSYYAKNFQPITQKELKNLAQTYNRDFTSGYLFNEKNIINSHTSNHQGIQVGTIISGNNQKIKIKLQSALHQGDAIRIANTDIGMYLNTLYNEKGLLVSAVPKNSICEIANKDRILVKDYIGKPILKTIDFLLNKDLLNYQSKKIPITMEFIGIIEKKALLIIKDSLHTITTEGPLIEPAENRGVSPSKITEHLQKLGNTPFIAQNIKIDIDDNIFINFKDINELRRQAIEKLIQKREGHPNPLKHIELKEPISQTTTPEISILVRNEDQLTIAIRNNIPIIYTTDKSLYQKYKTKTNIYLRLNRVRTNTEEYQKEKLLCTELGSIAKYAKNNIIVADYTINICNDYTISSLRKLAIQHATLSIELDIDKLKRIKDKAHSEIIVYGYPECMIIKNNIFNLKSEISYLIDGKNHKYPIISENNFTHIFHYEPINHLKDLHKLQGFKSYRIELFNETPIETQNIINQLTKITNIEKNSSFPN